MRRQIRTPKLDHRMRPSAHQRVVQVGDRVGPGRAVAEIELEKAAVEMRPRQPGRLSRSSHQVGVDIAVAEVISWLDDES